MFDFLSSNLFAYLLPLFELLKREEIEGSIISRPFRPRSIILVPNRELADQVTRVCKSLVHQCPLRVNNLITSESTAALARALKDPKDITIISNN